jgi:hypothetical protein
MGKEETRDHVEAFPSLVTFFRIYFATELFSMSKINLKLQKTEIQVSDLE